MAQVDILGIRHHGPGSARSVRAALEAAAPDVVLIEGPPEATGLIGLVADAELRPPVAILAYDPEVPARSSFYPFAEFSPEWQAMRYGVEHGIRTAFADLPIGQALLLRAAVGEGAEEPERPEPPDAEGVDASDEAADGSATPSQAALRQDPLGALGEAIGEDGERWWDRFIEHRQDPAEVFTAVAELMGELRAGVDATPTDLIREAAMREAIREAESAGAGHIAFVCGAFHAPALLDRADAAADRALLADLASGRVETTWVPWSEAHLSMLSGYGAGIESPGWYGHLWSGGQPSVERWLVKTAHLLREEGFDTSPAHLIETARLAETTAALRGRSSAGLAEVIEATRSVITMGSDVPIALIAGRLLIGTGIGSVPATVDTAPLARDLAAEQRRLRLPPEVLERRLELDLRGDTDLGRSHLLHRLRVLDVPWGRPAADVRRAMGTFREPWQLQWDPMFAVALVTQSRWGNTIRVAAGARLLDEASTIDRLDQLAARLELSLYADLPDATAGLTARIGALSAVAADVAAILEALPALARSLRYGSVRDHGDSALEVVVTAMLQRAAVGLPGAVTALDDDGAAEMVGHIEHGSEAVSILDRPELRDIWAAALRAVCDRSGINGRVVGRCVRLLLDQGRMDAEESAARLAVALSRGAGPEHTIGYLDGFLAGSGALLVHDPRLFSLVDTWLMEQTGEGFEATLPYLRRTFSRFTVAERRSLQERARRADHAQPAASAVAVEDEPAPALDLLDSLLGLDGDPD